MKRQCKTCKGITGDNPCMEIYREKTISGLNQVWKNLSKYRRTGRRDARWIPFVEAWKQRALTYDI